MSTYSWRGGHQGTTFEQWDCSSFYRPAVARGTYDLLVLNRWMAMLRMARTLR